MNPLLPMQIAPQDSNPLLAGVPTMGGVSDSVQMVPGAASSSDEPPDYTNKYNTKLSPADEAAYQLWGQQQAAQQGGRNPATDTYDYDMRGFWKNGGQFSDNGHAGDTFKKPNHPTFSTFSQYHGADGNKGGVWSGGQDGQPWTFTPSATNLKNFGAPALRDYFSKVEPGNLLVIPTKPSAQQ